MSLLRQRNKQTEKEKKKREPEKNQSKKRAGEFAKPFSLLRLKEREGRIEKLPSFAETQVKPEEEKLKSDERFFSFPSLSLLFFTFWCEDIFLPSLLFVLPFSSPDCMHAGT